MADQKLMDYIRQNIGKMGETRVRKALLDSGWQEKQVSEAIAEYSASQKPAAQPAVKPSQPNPAGNPSSGKKFPVIPVAVIAVLALLAVAVFVMFPDIFSFTPAEAACGNGICEPGEDSANCPDDCPAAACGNGVCDPGETYANCPADCDKPPPEPIGISVSAPATASVGDTVTASIIATDAVNLFGFQFNLLYDPGILSFQSSDEGPFLNNNGADSTFCVPVNTETSGELKNFACTRLNSGGSVTGVDGTGTLATVTFTALSSGTSQLTLTNVKFADTSAESIPADITSASVTIG